MTHPNPTLGIAIPTYKRPDQLRACVQSVLRAAAPHHVPIYLLDDSMDDTNAAVYAELRPLYPHLHIQHNPKNLGIDRNILHAADTCPCTYVWLLGEDDRMHPHGIQTVLDTIATHPNPFLYVNYSAVDNDLRFLIKERSLPLHTLQEMPGDTFFRDYAWSMGFLGACVIRKTEWARTDPTPYLDSYFAHVGRIMHMIQTRAVTLIPDPLVLNRCGSPEIFTWTQDAHNVFTGWDRMTRALESQYPADTCQAARLAFQRAHGIGSLKFYAYLRADRVFTPALCEQLLDQYPGSSTHTHLARLIAHTPPALFRGARTLLMKYRQFRSPPLDPLTIGSA